MTFYMVLTCDVKECTKKLWIQAVSKQAILKHARKQGWLIKSCTTGECLCVGHRILKNGGVNPARPTV